MVQADVLQTARPRQPLSERLLEARQRDVPRIADAVDHPRARQQHGGEPEVSEVGGHLVDDEAAAGSMFAARGQVGGAQRGDLRRIGAVERPAAELPGGDVEIIQLASGADLGVAAQHALDQARPRAGHPHDEDGHLAVVGRARQSRKGLGAGGRDQGVGLGDQRSGIEVSGERCVAGGPGREGVAGSIELVVQHAESVMEHRRDHWGMFGRSEALQQRKRRGRLAQPTQHRGPDDTHHAVRALRAAGERRQYLAGLHQSAGLLQGVCKPQREGEVAGVVGQRVQRHPRGETVAAALAQQRPQADRGLAVLWGERQGLQQGADRPRGIAEGLLELRQDDPPIAPLGVVAQQLSGECGGLRQASGGRQGPQSLDGSGGDRSGYGRLHGRER